MIDLAVFIGRFQPPHAGHLAVAREGLRHASRLLVLVGSTNRPRSTRDPFTFEERRAMLAASLEAEGSALAARTNIAPLADAMYSDARWIAAVHRAVRDEVARVFPDRDPREVRVALAGHSKDSTTYYLKLFPTWEALEVRGSVVHNATTTRNALFTRTLDDDASSELRGRLPSPVLAFLRQFQSSADFEALLAEAEFVQRYRAEFAGLRYPPSFMTVDAVVVQSGHVLLVKRGVMPGKGLAALPGGFIRQDEPALEACLRELREETRLKVPEAVLRGSVSRREFFDDPHRSARGRTFTMAFRFDLREDRTLPKVKGGDDANAAFWVPLGELDARTMFEDHFFIVQSMLGL